MRYRVFGRTGFEVSTVSMGCNRLGDPGADPAQWPPIVEQALALGVNFFDTSNSYNQGRSEAVLGDVLSVYPRRTYVSTKVGIPVETNDTSHKDFSARSILVEVENSLSRLRRETIDLYMLHSPTVRELETVDWATAVDKLKAQGKVRYFGISTQNHASGIWAIGHGADFLQIEYHILDWSAEDELLPLAQRENVGIMVRMPLARGLLTGKFPVGQPIPPEQQWRRPTGDLLQTRLQRIEQLRFLEREGQTMAQAAIRFVLSHPAVHCAIPGARTPAQLEANVAASDGDLTPAELSQIRERQREWGS
ncbi:MAG TPA: aldo/keto reductase [Chloroflexota bacterium]|nr:aldo/keto reductase [Chloroflexota bacterium]